MMNWAEVTAICSVFVVTGSIFLFATRAIVRDEIAKLDRTYLRADLAREKFKQIDEHFDYLAQKHNL